MLSTNNGKASIRGLRPISTEKLMLSLAFQSAIEPVGGVVTFRFLMKTKGDKTGFNMYFLYILDP